MNKPDLQLNLHDLISCSCWDNLVLHVGVQLFLGESNQRVTVYLQSRAATWLSVACCMASNRKLSGACMGMRLLRLCVAEDLQQDITSSIVARPSHSQLFDHLQHKEGLGDFADRGERVREISRSIW